MKSIDEKVKRLRNEIEQDKDYTKMIKQIDKYWDKLLADPITVDTQLVNSTSNPSERIVLGKDFLAI